MRKALSTLVSLVMALLVYSCTEKEPAVVHVSDITLNPTSVSMVEGETTTISATVSPNNADNQKVLWSSDNSSVATVNNGTITAVGEGTATITAKSDDGGKTATCSVSVKSKAVSVESVSLDKTAITLRVGGTAEVKATISPDNATNKTIEWKSSDESIASVKDGVITGVGLGTCSITATVDGKTATCTITVEATPVESIIIDPSSATLRVGGTTEVMVSISPDDATNKTIEWKSSDEKVAVVDGGTITGVGIGSCSITATVDGKTATCAITVEATPVESITISVDKAEVMEGETLQLSATVLPKDATDRTVVWSSSDESVAKVSGDGLVSAVSVGQTTITAVSGDKSASCMVLVSPAPTPLTFTAVGNSSVVLIAYGSPSSIQLNYRKGSGEWTPYEVGQAIQLSDGENVSFCRVGRGRLSSSSKNYHHFVMTGQLMASGNVLSLVDEDMDSNADVYFPYLFKYCSSLLSAPELPATKLYLECYKEMFSGCTSLVNAPKLPATRLDSACYESMFSGCTSLVNAPKLPASILAKDCYRGMFDSCTSLVNAPELPASILAEDCYRYMFSGCKSLLTAPELPATTLADRCYCGMFRRCTSLLTAPALHATKLPESCYANMFEGCASLVNAPKLLATSLSHECYYTMFKGCTSLVNAPELPATILADWCYASMFSGCTSLVNAPKLPAIRLTSACYENMFGGCTSLSYVKALFTSIDNSEMISSWLSGVSKNGTFIRNPEATWTREEARIPKGWTIVDAE